MADPLLIQDPAAKFDYTFDWSARLAQGDTIVGRSWTITPATGVTQLRLDSDFVVDDPYIETLQRAAVESVEAHIAGPLVSRDFDQLHERFPCWDRIVLARAPVTAIEGVHYTAEGAAGAGGAQARRDVALRRARGRQRGPDSVHRRIRPARCRPGERQAGDQAPGHALVREPGGRGAGARRGRSAVRRGRPARAAHAILSRGAGMIPRIAGRGGLAEYVSFEKRALAAAGGAAGLQRLAQRLQRCAREFRH